MEDLSEKAIKKNCPHCDLSSQAFRYPLEQTKDFYLVVDSHPIVEGHILIISKKHIGELLDAEESLINHMFVIVRKMIRNHTISGYRIVNNGKGAAFVDHLHIHVMGHVDKNRKL